jgi:hypothetical protein
MRIRRDAIHEAVLWKIIAHLEIHRAFNSFEAPAESAFAF